MCSIILLMLGWSHIIERILDRPFRRFLIKRETRIAEREARLAKLEPYRTFVEQIHWVR